MKSWFFNALLALTAFLITCGAVTTGTYFRTGLTVEVGEISKQKIKATSYVENKIATERNRAEAEARAADMKPIVMLDSATQNRVEENLKSLFIKLDSIRLSYRYELESREQAQRDADQQTAAEQQAEDQRIQAEQEASLARQAESAPEAGVGEPDGVTGMDIIPLPDETKDETTGDAAADITTPPAETEPPLEQEPEPFAAFAMFSALPVIFTENQQQYLATMADEEYLSLTETVYEVTDTAMEQGVQEVDNKTLLSVREECTKSGLTGEAANITYQIVSVYLTVNVVVNEEATRLERERIAADYKSVYLLKDQTIVDDGEFITEEAYAIMQSLGMLSTGLMNRLVPMVGAFILIAAVFAMCLLYLVLFKKTGAGRKNEPILLFALYCLILAVTWTLGDVGYPFLPLLVFAMLVSILIDTRASVVLTFGLTVVCYFVVSGSIEYFLFYLLAGTLIALLSKYTTERNKVFVIGLAAAAINFILSYAIALLIEKNNALNMWPSIMATAGIASVNGILTVIICTGSLPLWEAVFGVVTPVKLLDLTNPTNLLLRRLTIEAPGTYHHSLIVANLAETAAYDIGANPGTARAGGYYHDIGKLKYPQYFAENLAGENPHDHLDPYNSVQLIISHIAYGLTLASEYRLPQFIRDIIQEHHGTSLIYFFYCKAKSDGQPVDEKDFRYPYVIPQSRESACIMLADTVEAAIRSMIPRVKSINEVESQINTLIRDKLNDGQLAESGLSIKDVDTIARSFFRVLKGMYHERIPYPKKLPDKTSERLPDRTLPGAALEAK